MKTNTINNKDNNVIDFPTRAVIELSSLEASSKEQNKVNIKPAKEIIKNSYATEHSAQPIKDINDIVKLSNYFISKGKYRDNMLFILGINFGLRISDIQALRFCDLINEDFTFKDEVTVFEIKTRNTRKKSKNRHIAINQQVKDAVILYLKHNPNKSLSDHMFVSESYSGQLALDKYNSTHFGYTESIPITRQGVDYIIKQATKAIGLEGRYATHTFRKTFAYHFMQQHDNDPRALQLLQKMFNHSSVRQTMDYIGITDDEIFEAYSSLGDYYANRMNNSNNNNKEATAESSKIEIRIDNENSNAV